LTPEELELPTEPEQGLRGPAPRESAGGVISPRWRRRDRTQRRALLLADLVGLTAAFTLASMIAGFRDDSWELVLLLLPTLPAWAIIFKLYGLYDRDVRRISHSGIDDLPYLFHAFVVGVLLFWAYLKWGTDTRLLFAEAAWAGVLAIPLLVVLRSVARLFVLGYEGPERVLIAGAGATSALVVRKISQHPEYGLVPVGRLGPSDPTTEEWDVLVERGLPRSLHVPLLGSAADLEQLIGGTRIDRAILCRADLDPDAVARMADICHRYGVKVGIVPGASEAYGPSVELDEVEGVTVLGVNPPVLGRTSRALKRGFDIIVASLILLLSSPVVLIAMIAIPLDSRGPVFYRQRRVGKGGEQFTLLKLRTMVVDADRRREELMATSADPNWLHIEDDPRITRVGGFLRSASIDELPQLINVLKGEMSMVGPRPLPAEEDAKVGGWGRSRLDLTPGITGLWQVLGRASIPFEEMVKLDYSYVTNWSLWMDMRLILRTLPAVLRRRGAN
jgi:exopolysaccharide biosynthesis polyprenyl glycosylphosphotransferase